MILSQDFLIHNRVSFVELLAKTGAEFQTVEKPTCHEVSFRTKIAVCTTHVLSYFLKNSAPLYDFLRKLNPKRVFWFDKLGVFGYIRGFVRLNRSQLDQSLLTISRSDLNQLKIEKEFRIFDLSCFFNVNRSYLVSLPTDEKSFSRTFI